MKQETSQWGKAVKKAVIDHDMTLKQLAEKIGYSNATVLCDRLGIRTSTMSTWKTRNSDPPAKYIKPIADFLGVSVHYLLTGEEAPARKLTTAEEDELLELYRALPQNKQFEFIGELKGFLKAYTESQKYLDKEKRLSV